MFLRVSLCASLDRVGEFTVYPWVHSFSNQRTAALQLKAVTIPDILPRDIPTGVEFSMAAGEFLEVYQEDQGRFDSFSFDLVQSMY